MIEAYAIGTTLKLNDLITPGIDRIARAMKGADALQLALTKHGKEWGVAMTAASREAGAAIMKTTRELRALAAAQAAVNQRAAASKPVGAGFDSARARQATQGLIAMDAAAGDVVSKFDALHTRTVMWRREFMALRSEAVPTLRLINTGTRLARDSMLSAATAARGLGVALKGASTAALSNAITASAGQGARALDREALAAARLAQHLQTAQLAAVSTAGTLGGLPGLGRGGRGSGGGGVGGGSGGGGHGGGPHAYGHLGPGGLGLGAIGMGLSGAALPALALGYVGYATTRAGYDAARDFQSQTMRFRSLGLGDKTTGEAIDFVGQHRPFGSSQAEHMKMLSEATGIFGSFEEAQKFSPLIMELAKANQAIFAGHKHGRMDDGEIKSLIKFIDRRGGFKDEPTFLRNLDLAERLVTGSGGFIDFGQLNTFSQRGGTAFRSLDDVGQMQMGALISEQGGSAAGTALMSIYQNLVAGRTPKKTMGVLQDMGLVTLGMETHGNVGGKPMQSLVVKTVKEVEMLQRRPFEWFQKVVIPALEAKGITDESAQLAAVNAILSNRTGSNQGSIMTTQGFQILRDFRMTKGAMGATDAIGQYKAAATGAEDEFVAAWTDFKKEFGQVILPQVTKMLRDGAAVLRAIGEFTAGKAKDQSPPGIGSALLSSSPIALGYKANGLAARAGHWLGEKLGVFQPEPTGVTGPADNSASWLGHGPSKSVLAGAGAPMLQVHTTTTLDGRKVAETVSRHQASMAARPSNSTSLFDNSMNVRPIGMVGN